MTLFVSNYQDNQDFQQIEFVPPDYFVQSDILHINLQQNWPLNATPLNYYMYLTFCSTSPAEIFGDNVLFMDELVYAGKV